MPNATYDFAASAGQTIVFDAATDTLSFGAGFSAASLTLVQAGSGSGATVTVTIGGVSVILQGMTLDKLRLAALSFADGSVAQIGDGLATTGGDVGANTMTGGAGHDYFDGQSGNDTINSGAGNDTIYTGIGTDTVNAGADDDRIFMGADLAAADRIDGGAGTDELRLSGNYSGLTMVDGTIRNIELLTLEGDNNLLATRTYKLTTHDTTVANGATLTVDASGLDGADKLDFDGSAESSASFAITGGAGSDVIKGGAGDDTIVAGAGNDTITGGQGADVLTGGTGDDLFIVARGTSKSDSSPTSIDRITDFEGAGAIGGDRIQLPIPSGGKPLAFAGYKAFSLGGGIQAPNVGDGFADVFYDHLNGQTRIVIDVNDDGLISEVDQVIYLDGIFDLQAEDFDAAFTVVRGTDAADDILGSAYGETINALGGDDVVDGRGGNDTILGGTGADDLHGGAGNDTIDGGDQDDTVHGDDDNDTVSGGEGNDTLFGDQGGDTLNGNNGVDTIDGGIGNDTIAGGAGEDVLHGGANEDTVNGNADNDEVFGDAGNDILYGDAGDDAIDGGADNDKLTGGQGVDTLHGGDGNDIVNGDDTSAGDGAADWLYGDAGDDTLYAGTGRDVLTGGSGADKFVVTNATSSAAYPNRVTDFSVAEGDKLQLQISGAKPLAWYGNKPFFFDGTFGNGGVQFPLANDGLADAIWDYDAATNTTRIAVDVNDDGVFSTGDLLVYLDGQFTLTAADFVDTFAVVRGGAGADVMPGTANADTYYGMGGNDTISGEGGNDTLYGGDDDDTIDGGVGQDTINGDAGNDTLSGGAGTFGDTISGGAGNDLINGGDGGDVINGNADNDTVNGELGDDTVYGGEGNDTVTGGDGNDSVYGQDQDDVADGGQGNDVVDGGNGNDTVTGGTGNDTLYGGAGTDSVSGGDGDDKIWGDAGADTLDGGAGIDTLYLGAGDLVTGGTDGDKFNLYYNSNTSVFAAQARITDFAPGSDRLDIAGINGTGITFVFNGGDRQLGALSVTAGSQTILGNGGDGLADVLYTTSADGLTTWLIVDVNDDGKLDAADVVLAFDGDLDFTTADFTTGMFKVFRGSEGADTITGSDAVDTVYGVGGNDEIDGLGGNDLLYGQAGDDNIDGGLGQDTIDGGDDNDTLYGGDGVTTDYLYGGNGNDQADGGDGDDFVYGQAGNDTLQGGLGGDTVDGGAGDDVIDGGDGDDTLRGAADNDTITGGAGKDSLDGGDGVDTLHGGDNNDTLDGGNGEDHVFGDAGDDLIYSSAGADELDGGAGSDTIWIGANDTATGGADADKFRSYYNSNMSNLAGQARITDFQHGIDTLELLGANGTGVKFVFNGGDQHFGTLSTANGSQTILGNAGDGLADIYYSVAADGLSTQLIVDINDDGKLDAGDVVIRFDGNADFTMADFAAGTFTVQRGTAGADVMTGGNGADTIYGVGGNDQIDGADGDDTLYGQDGDDTIEGGTGKDTIDGGEGNDTLTGGPGDFTDYLYGGNGNDGLTGGEGSDYLYGQAGADALSAGLGDDTADGGAGDDAIDGGEGADTLRGGNDNDTVHGGLGNDGIDGGDGADILYGDDNNDTIDGGAGNDDLFGGEGNDTLYGSTGADDLDGGAGDDTIVFGKGDVVTGGAGADKFRTYFNSDISTLASAARITDFQQGIDKLEVVGISGVRLFAVNPGPVAGGIQIGDALPFGNDAFADIVFTHETGPDGPVTRVFIDENDNGKLDATDIVFELSGHINLTAADFTTATFNAVRGTPGDDGMTGGSAGDAIYGAAGNDTISGGAGNDSLYGQDGDDTLNGEADNDSLYGGAGNDTLNGGIGGDSQWGEAGNDTLEGNEGNDSLYGGLDNDTLRGGFGDDTLSGNEGNDQLEGGADSDTLYGGDGQDNLLGQDGADTLKGDAGDDMIQGGALNDTITGGAGNDTIDGGTEIDTAVFSGNIANYEIVAGNGGITVRDLRTGSVNDGTDFLTNVEKLQFADGTVQGSFLTVSDGVVVEGDNGQLMMAFTVSLIGAPANAVTVSYGTTNGTATSGSDYGATSGSLSFAVGETSKIVYVPINGDTVNEIDEVFSLTLNNASGAAIVDGVGQGTILNDDCTVSIGDAQLTEGNSNKTLSFTISLDKPAAGPISVSYKTMGGSATEGVDYTAASGFVQFAAGEQTRTITITIAGDMLAELDESFWVQLLSVTGAKIGDGTAVGTIVNDDLNHAPVAGADAFTLAFGQTLQTSAAVLLANDSDQDAGQTLSLVSVQDALHGTVSLVEGNIVFTPAAGYSGPASFTYTVSDGIGGTTTGTVNITIDPAAAQDDIFYSTAADESFDGGEGNDTVSYANVAAGVVVKLTTEAAQNTGAGGKDVLKGIENLSGSMFDDQLSGNAGVNILSGGNGNDTLKGDAGDDTLDGGLGNDVLDGGAGADNLAGGAGNDRYSVDDAGDTIVEAADGGVDLVNATISWTLGDNLENLTLLGDALDGFGNALANQLTGNKNNNLLDGGAGADTMKGGLGNDRYIVDNSGDVVLELEGEGSDIVEASVSFSLAGQHIEALTLTGSAAINGTGNSLANRITGNAAANTLSGADGNDRLDGGAGADRMVGGLGNDTFVVDNAGDVVVENVDEGTDTIESSISYSLAGRQVEILKLVGDADINATGNTQANTLNGNSGNNVLNGGGGADQMAGGAGDDRYIVDDAGDKVLENAGEGTDTVESSVTFTLAGQNIEILKLTGSAAINGTGNSLANAMWGNGAANTLNGGAGDDALHGGLGADVLTGGTGVDSYWFETALGTGNVDRITDFKAVDDTIMLDRSVFGGIGADGTLAAGAFQLGSVAVDADDRILYDAATGNIWYDADGAGGAAATLFAQVAAGTALTHADFVAVP